jgi:hypothetical protein
VPRPTPSQSPHEAGSPAASKTTGASGASEPSRNLSPPRSPKSEPRETVGVLGWAATQLCAAAAAGGGHTQVTTIGEALQANVKNEKLPVPFVEDCGALGSSGVSDAALVALYESRKSANEAALAQAMARRDETPQHMAERCAEPPVPSRRPVRAAERRHPAGGERTG